MVADHPAGEAGQDRRPDLRHGRYMVFQLAEVAVPRALFADILRRIDGLRPRSPPLPHEDEENDIRCQLSRRSASIADREALLHSDNGEGRKPRNAAVAAWRRGPGRRRLAVSGEPPHDCGSDKDKNGEFPVQCVSPVRSRSAGIQNPAHHDSSFCEATPDRSGKQRLALQSELCALEDVELDPVVFPLEQIVAYCKVNIDQIAQHGSVLVVVEERVKEGMLPGPYIVAYLPHP